MIYKYKQDLVQLASAIMVCESFFYQLLLYNVVKKTLLQLLKDKN